MLLSRFFIDRPVFAWVIAIVIMLAGAISAFSLPVAQYPTIAPPAVVVNAIYPGADAATLQNSVTQVIEQQLTGLDNLLYFASTSNADGTVAITATFAPGTDPDIAQVQVQNKVQQAMAQLPAQVQQLGVTVAKAQANFLLLVGMYDESDRFTSRDVADFMISKLQDSLLRVPGVGTAIVFGSPYAMRIWLDPYKLHDYALRALGYPRRHPGPECSGLRRFDRRPARRSRPGLERHRHRPVAAADAGAVPRHHPEDHAKRRGRCICRMWRGSNSAPTIMALSAR